jgi:hypothetical protein
MDKIGINNIKNSSASYMLLKKGTHITFTNYVGGDFFNPVWRKTMTKK